MRSFISGTSSPSSYFVGLFAFNLFQTCPVYIWRSASLSMPSFRKSRSSKTIPPVVEPSCCSNGWHAADSGAFTYIMEQPRSCHHHHPSQSARALSSILHLGCGGGGAEHTLPSIWCNSRSLWNDAPKLFNAQRPPRSLMLLFILIRNLGQELMILS